MKRLAILLLLLACAAGTSQAALRIYGLYMAEVNLRDNGQRYYQDTMFTGYTPSATFDGCVDDLVLGDWYAFGNEFESLPEYVANNLADPGQRAQYKDCGTCSGVKIKALDPEKYKLLNAVTVKTATAANPAAYLSGAGVRRVPLFNGAELNEGVNRFTIVCPQANELLYSAMCGIFLYEGSETSFSTKVMPKEGTEPDLCAMEAGSGTQDMEGAWVVGAPNPRKDMNYFQDCKCHMEHPTLSCVKGEYRIQVTYFYLAGSNTIDVNPDGLTSPPSCGLVAEGDVDPNWALTHSPGNEVAYLEITVTKASVEPVLSTPSIILPARQSAGAIQLENRGAGSFTYSASAEASWLTLDSEAASGTVTLQQKIPFTVNRAGLEEGVYSATVSIDVPGHETFACTVQAVVAPEKTGAVRLAGLHIMGSMSDPAYYQDTMIKSTVPSAAFDGGSMDILLVSGTYLFGNDSLMDFCPYSDYLAANAKDLGKGAEFTTVGSYCGEDVYRLSGEVYPLINPVLDNGLKPESDSLSAYVKAAGLVKQPLDCYLQEGVNQFTLVLPSASEFQSEPMQIGLFLGNPVAGAKPDLAAIDSELDIDAINSFYAPYTFEDLKYHFTLDPICLYNDSTLKCQKNGYEFEITKFFLLGQNAEDINPNGLTSPATPGYVSTGDGASYWAIQSSPDTTLAYLEVVATQIPEPAAISLLLLGALALCRRR